jgi:hypothetical protein
MRLPSSPRIAAAFPVSRHAAQTATVARGGGARGEKRTVGQGGEGCRGARLKAKAVVLTAVGDVVVEDCKLSNREPGDRDGVGSVAKFQFYI